MRSFDYTALQRRAWDGEILSYVAQIHEYKGKQELFLRQKPIELNRLIEVAKIQSTESSNQIEGIVTTQPRLKQLMADKTTPRNREEEEILGYRNVLSLIHENYTYIAVTPNYILQLHRELMKYTALSYGGRFKNIPNEIDMVLPTGERRLLFQPLAPFETPEAVERICSSFRQARAQELADALLLIPCFLLDFLCIHPFNDGNGRMSRLLTLLLLYQSGYLVGQYVSIEKAIADTKENYYDALARADQEWQEGRNDPTPFIKYMLAIILSCYKEFERRLHITAQEGTRSTSYDIVKTCVAQKIGSFSKQEILTECPSIGRSSVEAALKKLVAEGFLDKIGAGRQTRYVRKI
ncbi:MAG: Fic family protein [Selenomonas sp.]|uniref:Fic family protein n=1 Tax=Selenomonas sp. TaxID=2053611 RepID=UPI0025DD1893|nr:Fic family protein [Selenomonas sp.]MCI6232091.1 Fic family protein [Selenomonas sp.]